MKFFFLTLFPFFCFGQWNQIGTDIDGQSANEQSSTAISLNAAGTILINSAIRALDAGIMKGKARVFEWNGTSWLQKGSDLVGTSQGDVFGDAVSISADGNTIAVGAPGNNSPTYLDPNGPTGYTRIFEWDGSNWIQKGTDINGEAPNDVAGTSISINATGTIIAIGASSNNGANGVRSGHCRIYEWNGSDWTQKGSDIDGEAANDFSGTAVALNYAGSIVVIGASGNDAGGTNSGQVRVYEWNGTNWIQKGTDVDGDTINKNFGYRISLDESGTTFIAGGYSFVNAALGFIKIFIWNGTNWVQKGQTILGSTDSGFFGTSVDISQDGNIIAASSLTSNGDVRVFKFVGSFWTQQGSDILGEASSDQFGRSLSLSANGSILAAGTPYNDGNGTNAGHLRVYENTTLSITDFETIKISLYPNPVSDTFEISGIIDNQNYTIYSVLGTKIQTGTVSKNQKIDVKNFSNGIYVLKLENGESIKFVKK